MWKFINKNKNCGLLKRSILEMPIEAGGLNAPNLDLIENTIKIRWIERLLIKRKDRSIKEPAFFARYCVIGKNKILNMFPQIMQTSLKTLSHVGHIWENLFANGRASTTITSETTTKKLQELLSTNIKNSRDYIYNGTSNAKVESFSIVKL